MNNLIKQQLTNCRVANIPPFTDDTTHIEIPKGSTVTISEYQIHKCYLIKLEDYILNPPPNFTLAENWNRGSIPSHKYYKCEILQLNGKMVKIMGCGYLPDTDTDTIDVWSGWVPQAGISIIKELR